MQNNENFQVINTKISIPAYRRLISLIKRKGLNWYRLIQMYVDITIRYMDGWHNLTEEMERMMHIFEEMTGWEKALTLGDTSAKMIVGEATYYMFDQDGERKGARAVHVKKPFFGNWEQNFNVQDILERTICMLIPARYRRLRQLAVELEKTNMLDLLDFFIAYFSKHSDMETIRKEFEDADRSEYGRKPHEGEPFRRHHHRTPDSVENSQKVINFTDDDRELAEREANCWSEDENQDMFLDHEHE